MWSKLKIVTIQWIKSRIWDMIDDWYIKVQLTLKYFLCSNKSLHLFETHCTFLPLFNSNLDFLQVVKLRNVAIICRTTEQVRGMGLFLGWRHKLLCMHVYKDLIRCKSFCNINPGIDPYPLLGRSCNRWWPDFVTFTACKKSRLRLKRGKRRNAFQTGAKIYLSETNILGLGAL